MTGKIRELRDSVLSYLVFINDELGVIYDEFFDRLNALTSAIEDELDTVDERSEPESDLSALENWTLRVSDVESEIVDLCRLAMRCVESAKKHTQEKT